MAVVRHPRLWWLVGGITALVLAASPAGWWDGIALAGVLAALLILRPSRTARRPLVFASFFALGFLLIRVFYRVVFGAASFGGLTLWHLDSVHLPGPFSHIVLFGTVTTGGLLAAALSALPFATTVLIFGMLNTVADARRLFTSSSTRFGQNLRQALLIGLAAYPALVNSVAAVRWARTLRGERGAASFFVPVFEHSIERALGLAASMEVRGYGAPRESLHGLCEAPVVARDVTLRFPSGWHVTEVNVRIEPGTITVLTGATGSGKSTLLASLTGLFQHFSGGDQNGIIEIGGLNRARTLPRETADFVSFVSQNVRSTFVAPTVREEISYGLVVRGASRVDVDDRVRTISQQLGLATLLDRPVETLSAGEATIVAIAAALVTQPSLLILDEPLADLDGPATARVLSILCDLAADTQIPIVIAEHRTVELTTIATHWLRIVKGRLEEGIFESEPAPVPGELSGSPSVALRASIRSLTVRHGAAPVVSDVSFDIFAGDIFAFRGHNGAGKSSLLNAVAQPHSAGNTFVDGVDLKTVRPRERRRLVALVPEHYEDLLFCSSVARECEVADRRARAPQGTTLGLFTALLDGTLQHQPPLLDIHPRDLSTGQRLALVIAIQLAAAPRLLLIDEPTRGLDPQARRELTRTLHRVARPSSVIGAPPSTAVIFASHDRDFIEATATMTFDMTDGLLTPAGEAACPPASGVRT